MWPLSEKNPLVTQWIPQGPVTWKALPCGEVIMGRIMMFLQRGKRFHVVRSSWDVSWCSCNVESASMSWGHHETYHDVPATWKALPCREVIMRRIMMFLLRGKRFHVVRSLWDVSWCSCNVESASMSWGHHETYHDVPATWKALPCREVIMRRIMMFLQRGKRFHVVRSSWDVSWCSCNVESASMSWGHHET